MFGFIFIRQIEFETIAHKYLVTATAGLEDGRYGQVVGVAYQETFKLGAQHDRYRIVPTVAYATPI